MKIEYNSAKSEKNKLERELSFDCVAEFDWETAIFSEDLRHLYPERRFIALGLLHKRLHVLCFTPIPGGIRVISFRKANLREVRRYESETINQ